MRHQVCLTFSLFPQLYIITYSRKSSGDTPRWVWIDVVYASSVLGWQWISLSMSASTISLFPSSACLAFHPLNAINTGAIRCFDFSLRHARLYSRHFKTIPYLAKRVRRFYCPTESNLLSLPLSCHILFFVTAVNTSWYLLRSKHVILSRRF